MYEIKQTITLPKEGIYGLAIHSNDQLNNSRNICGIHTLEVLIDGKRTYLHEMDSLNFYTFRYMNAHTDFEIQKKTKTTYHKCFKEI